MIPKIQGEGEGGTPIFTVGPTPPPLGRSPKAEARSPRSEIYSASPERIRIP